MSTQTPRPYRLTPDGYLVPSSDSPEAYVEQALRAAKSGSAGHWPTVAAVLHDEVLRLRAELAERTRERDERFRSVVHQCCEDVQTLRAELERERNPNVELSLANQSAFSASLAAVQARYADGFKLERDEARVELADLRAKQTKMVDLLIDLADPDPCQFDHHGGCQAHGFLSLEAGEQCPVQEAKDLIESWPPAVEPAEATAVERLPTEGGSE